MITIRKSKDRGNSRLDWLNSYHTFSFSDYYDSQWMEFGCLRVINEDTIQPGCGFGMHAHRDMEIITYVVNGALSHKDSMGNGSIIRPGEIQRMSAGTSIKHSEFNASDTEDLHLLQIWITPEKTGMSPGYEQKSILTDPNQLVLIGSPDNSENAVIIHQNIKLYRGKFIKGKRLALQLHQRQCWLQLIRGSIQINDQQIEQGDGVAIDGEDQVSLLCVKNVEFLFFEML